MNSEIFEKRGKNSPSKIKSKRIENFEIDKNIIQNNTDLTNRYWFST